MCGETSRQVDHTETRSTGEPALEIPVKIRRRSPFWKSRIVFWRFADTVAFIRGNAEIVVGVADELSWR